VSLIV
jgi:hypothetical protein